MAMRPRARGYAIALTWIVIGAGAGALAAVTAERASRNPDGFLYAIRVMLGVPPTETFEAKWLERTYGPVRQSHGAEEWIVRDFFRDKRNGVFVDVGAADHKRGSNTWFLENQLGWSGLAVDAQDRYRADYEQHRPRTRFFTLFVSDRSDKRMRLFLNENPELASWQQEFSARFGQVQGSTEVSTITLNDLLQAERVARFDFLSMDIELAEPKALAGLDLQRFRPQLVCIEAHPEVRQQILDYFARNEYVVIGKYLRVDLLNLWFMPAGSAVRPFPSVDEPAEWLPRWLPLANGS